MAAKFLQTHQNRKMRLAFIFTLFFYMLVPSLSWGQTFGFTVTEQNNQSFRPTQIFELPNKHFLISTEAEGFSSAWFQLLIVDSTGSIVAQYSDTNFAIEEIGINNTYIYAFGSELPNYPNNLRRVITFDDSLNILTSVIPYNLGWPRQYFISRRKRAQNIENQPAFLGTFTDSSNNEPNFIYGWLKLNETADTLIAHAIQYESDSIRLSSLHPADVGFYSNGFQKLITFPWSTTIAVNVIHQFDDSLKLIRSTDLSNLNSIPGFPRLLRSTQLRNIITNEHSVYGFAEYEAASPNMLSDIAYSFALYQFDRTLNFKKIAHQLAAVGRRAETRNFSFDNIAFDESKKFIYAMGSHCEPMPLNFNNQNRTCAFTILKYDTALNLVWRQEIEMPKTFLKAEVFTSTPDGGILVAGMRIDSTPNPNVSNIFVVKLDSNGRHSVSVPELPQTAQVKVYPNPVEDVMLIQWDQGAFHQIEIYNLQGQKCGSWKTEPQTNLMELQLGFLPTGLYHYRLLGNGQLQTGKFVKK